jgi:gas vesicle protein
MKELTQMADNTSGVDFLAGFVVGALAGAAAALLFAPQSGEETRSLIRDKGIELREQADELSAEARKRAEGFQTQARERAEALSAQARATAGDLQTRVKEAVDEGKTAATTRREELLSSLEQARSSDETPAEA